MYVLMYVYTMCVYTYVYMYACIAKTEDNLEMHFQVWYSMLLSHNVKLFTSQGQSSRSFLYVCGVAPLYDEH